MTPFGYLVVVLSLVLALGVTRLLTGIGHQRQGARRRAHGRGRRASRGGHT